MQLHYITLHVGINCTFDGDGALLERVKTTMLRLLKKSAPRSSQNHTDPLRAPFTYSDRVTVAVMTFGHGPDIIAGGPPVADHCPKHFQII